MGWICTSRYYYVGGQPERQTSTAETWYCQLAASKRALFFLGQRKIFEVDEVVELRVVVVQ